VDVFDEVRDVVRSALDGFKVCIFAYGQTSAGKTYTMEGGMTEETLGLVPRSVRMVFETL
jgi:kinesin family protein C1